MKSRQSKIDPGGGPKKLWLIICYRKQAILDNYILGDYIYGNHILDDHMWLIIYSGKQAPPEV